VFESLDQTIETLIFRASGIEIDFPGPVIANSNVALVTFTTNNANTFSGWNLNFGIVPQYQ
jgi:hypothetical protein